MRVPARDDGKASQRTRPDVLQHCLVDAAPLSDALAAYTRGIDAEFGAHHGKPRGGNCFDRVTARTGAREGLRDAIEERGIHSADLPDCWPDCAVRARHMTRRFCCPGCHSRGAYTGITLPRQTRPSARTAGASSARSSKPLGLLRPWHSPPEASAPHPRPGSRRRSTCAGSSHSAPCADTAGGRAQRGRSGRRGRSRW